MNQSGLKSIIESTIIEILKPHDENLQDLKEDIKGLLRAVAPLQAKIRSLTEHTGQLTARFNIKIEERMTCTEPRAELNKRNKAIGVQPTTSNDIGVVAKFRKRSIENKGKKIQSAKTNRVVKESENANWRIQCDKLRAILRQRHRTVEVKPTPASTAAERSKLRKLCAELITELTEQEQPRAEIDQPIKTPNITTNCMLSKRPAMQNFRF